jgi:hypothetical protein
MGKRPRLRRSVSALAHADTPPAFANYNQLLCGQTLPVTFRNTRPHPCGLVSNERYRAET